MSRPIAYVWNGTCWEPEPRFRLSCQEEFGQGEVRWLEEALERSPRSHRHFFACVNEGWRNLPEHLTLEYPTPAKLRAHALIDTGHFTSTYYPCETKAEAVRWGEMVAREHPMDRVVVYERYPLWEIVRQTADSQSYKSMRSRKFQETKTDVLNYISNLIGVTVEELGRNADKAA